MVASSDRSINPIQERMMAKRAHAKMVEINASHVAYVSHPKETVKLYRGGCHLSTRQLERAPPKKILLYFAGVARSGI